MKIRCMGCMEEYDSYFDICPQCGTACNAMPEDGFCLRPGTILKQQYMVGLSKKFDEFSINYIGYDLVHLEKVTIKEYYPREYASRGMGTNAVNAYEGGREENFQKGYDSFLRDGHLLENQKMPGLCRIQDIFSENNTGYIVMEYLQGETLEEHLLKENRMSMGQALEYMMPVMETLSMLNNRQIYHCRVNPNNIFLMESGEVKITDFGGYQFDIPSQEKKISSMALDVYIAPELKQVVAKRSSSTDVYSVCAVLYRLVTGVPPIESVERMHSDTLLSPEKVGAQVNHNQDAIIMNGMFPNPGRRTGDFEELIEQLTSTRLIERKKEERPAPKAQNTVFESRPSAPADAMPQKKSVSGLILGAGIGVVVVIAIFAVCLITGNRSSSGKLTGDNNQTVTDSSSSNAINSDNGEVASQTPVPNLLNSDQEDAITAAQNQGFNLIVVDRENSTEIEKGKIISQSPEAGESSSSGNINVVVSAGSDTVSLDYIKGYDRLENLKNNFILTMEVTESYIIPGYVVSIERENGSTDESVNVSVGDDLPEGCALTVFTSSGVSELDANNVLTMPSLFGMSFGEALEVATENGFYVGLKEEKEYSRESVAEIGTICAMEYASTSETNQNTATAGDAVEKGDQVTQGSSILLTISKGPKAVKLSKSDYQGKALSTVEKLLDELYLTYDENNYDYVYSNSYTKGTVISIETTCHHEGISGTLHWDDTVNITVSKGPQPTTASKPPTSSSGGSSSSGSSGSGSSSGSSSKSGGSSSGGSSSGGSQKDALSDSNPE